MWIVVYVFVIVLWHVNEAELYLDIYWRLFVPTHDHLAILLQGKGAQTQETLYSSL